jgi:hypothetical protein
MWTSKNRAHRAGFLLSGIVTIRCYRMHLVSHVRSTIKILGKSIRRIFRCSMRIFASISCRQLRRCDGSIDIGCLRHENGWVWVGGRRCLSTPDDVIARFVSIGLNDGPRPVLTMISQLNSNRGIFDRVAVEGRWGLRRRRTCKHQKRYRKNTHGLSSIRATIKTGRDFSVNARLAIPIHYYPLSSVAHHSLKVQSRLQRVEWVERLVRRSSKSKGGSDTHQLQFAKMMGFAKSSTHPTRYNLS